METDPLIWGINSSVYFTRTSPFNLVRNQGRKVRNDINYINTNSPVLPNLNRNNLHYSRRPSQDSIFIHRQRESRKKKQQEEAERERILRSEEEDFDKISLPSFSDRAKRQNHFSTENDEDTSWEYVNNVHEAKRIKIEDSTSQFSSQNCHLELLAEHSTEGTSKDERLFDPSNTPIKQEDTSTSGLTFDLDFEMNQIPSPTNSTISRIDHPISRENRSWSSPSYEPDDSVIHTDIHIPSNLHENGSALSIPPLEDLVNIAGPGLVQPVPLPDSEPDTIQIVRRTYFMAVKPPGDVLWISPTTQLTSIQPFDYDEFEAIHNDTGVEIHVDDLQSDISEVTGDSPYHSPPLVDAIQDSYFDGKMQQLFSDHTSHDEHEHETVNVVMEDNDNNDEEDAVESNRPHADMEDDGPPTFNATDDIDETTNNVTNDKNGDEDL